ncbi:FAD:protein FMN transferase [Pelagicoccus sp. SDUM812002]|uniref:FAD:protein FMN transferase n=1 Tax=Pelagicoccus sp. SDUM812002 TaxID=3041266 RepID=UPI00280CD2FE|nr:FAD:protein FMN transferase [Pelagicoccus sp. SDUM812002]MDQ8185093.1 FAD:protein FMN transferase [Pelagicoccus sp. SDUM812002]
MSTIPPEPFVFIPADISSARGGAFRSDWQLHSLSGKTMGTHWSAKFSSSQQLDPHDIERTIIQSLDTVISQMSPWETDSDLRRYEGAPTDSWLVFHAEAFRVLEQALSIAQETSGAYDPTFAQAIDLLGFGPSSFSEYSYSSPEVQDAFTRAGFQRVELSPETRSVYQPGGLTIDLCSIAKGFAVDLACQRLRELGLENYLFEIGGEAKGFGCKPDGTPWLYEIELAHHAKDNLPRAQVALCGLSVATSANYLLYVQCNGQRVAHIVSPVHQDEADKTLSVSVFHDNCMKADAYATALFLQGTNAGLAFAEKRNLAAFFQTASGFQLSSQARELLA